MCVAPDVRFTRKERSKMCTYLKFKFFPKSRGQYQYSRMFSSTHTQFLYLRKKKKRKVRFNPVVGHKDASERKHAWSVLRRQAGFQRLFVSQKRALNVKKEIYNI